MEAVNVRVDNFLPDSDNGIIYRSQRRHHGAAALKLIVVMIRTDYACFNIAGV